MAKRGIVLLVVAAASAPCRAGTDVRIGPAQDWVEQAALGEPRPEQAAAPAQSLLSSLQTNFGRDGSASYIEGATLIQTPQGLAEVGTITIPWQPDRSDLTVHKVEVRRAGQIIDLLERASSTTLVDSAR